MVALKRGRWQVMVVGMLLGWMSTAAVAAVDLSAERQIGEGDIPHCVIDTEGNLHIGFFRSGNVYYKVMRTDGSVSTAETVPMGAKQRTCSRNYGSTVRICVDRNNDVHFSWTIGDAYYTNRIGGSWREPVRLPESPAQCNLHPKITSGYADEIYIHTWNYGEGSNFSGANSKLYRITKTSTATPEVEILFENGGASRRDGGLIGPTAQDFGDGKVYWADGVQHPGVCLLNANGTKGTCVSGVARSPAKTDEGYDLYYLGSDDVGIAVRSHGGDYPIIVNTIKRSRSKAGLIAGYGDHDHASFPRVAHDPVSGKTYVLFVKDNRPMLSVVDFKTDKVEQVGALTNGTLSGLANKGRGPSGGGICPHKDGGIHLLYSIGGKLIHRTADAQADPTASQGVGYSRMHSVTALPVLEATIVGAHLRLNLAQAGVSRGSLSVVLRDLTGRQLLRREVRLTGQGTVSVPLEHVARGAYILELSMGKERFARILPATVR